MSSAATAYDSVVYPSSVFPATSPGRLAAIARLHGLSAPPVETARVLEIGGGDGVNAIAMAAAYPDARFLSFDLSPSAVARGAALVAATGLGNVRVEMGDICAAARNLEARFDYVIAHGVYAWVPDAVREAAMVLIARGLAPDGVAFVSYNALPGGHLRRAIREMTLHEVGHVADPGERMLAARAFLNDYARPRAGDRPVVQAMRDVARPMAAKRLATLFHDELGDVYAPQSLTQVATAAAAHGLAFLNDANPLYLDDGFPGDGMREAAVVAAAQRADDHAMTFFRETLLVRADRNPRRSPDPAGIATLHMTSQAVRVEDQRFRLDEDDFTVGDDRLADALAGLARIWPHSAAVADWVEGDERLLALYALFARGVVALHAVPTPGVAMAGERPLASPLARAQITAGNKAVFTLDQRAMAMADPGPRAFLALLDGSRDRAVLARDWAKTEYGGEIAVDDALDRFAAAALLIR